MPKFDVRCLVCKEEWEAYKVYLDPTQCPQCGSDMTQTLMPKMKHNKGKDPYDMITANTHIPDSKPVKSFANDRRKGGKDTS
jgi:hypothetical protein